MLELLVVILILGSILAMCIPAYEKLTDLARVARCEEEIRGLEKSIGAYYADNGRLPGSLHDIGQDNLRDPWGHPYVYYNIASGTDTPYESIVPGEQLNMDPNAAYDLYSKGKDGLSAKSLTEAGLATSGDDIVRAADGKYVGLGSNY